jgi:hypothetical protein
MGVRISPHLLQAVDVMVAWKPPKLLVRVRVLCGLLVVDILDFMIDCQCYVGEIVYEEIQYEWFDVMWTEMLNFSKEHPHPKNMITGYMAIWDHPKPGYHACELGIDISDINLERYFKIKFGKYLNTYAQGRYPKELLDLFTTGNNGKPYQTQEHKLELARRIVKIAKESDTKNSQQP